VPGSSLVPVNASALWLGNTRALALFQGKIIVPPVVFPGEAAVSWVVCQATPERPSRRCGTQNCAQLHAFSTRALVMLGMSLQGKAEKWHDCSQE
jgi:hypothetical protein